VNDRTDDPANDPAGTPADARPRPGSDDATIVTRDGLAVIRFERVLARPPEEVWRAITDPDGLKAWFPCEVIAVSWRPGAPMTFRFGANGPVLTGAVLEAEPPRVLAYTWGEETLRFELAPADGGRTRLVFTDTLRPGIAARNAAGWQVCLAALQGEQPADDVWKEHFARYTAAFEPALGAQEGPPEGYEEYAR
jgi:uncharacterized protein YndB with AHSA1/START domain